MFESKGVKKRRKRANTVKVSETEVTQKEQKLLIEATKIKRPSMKRQLSPKKKKVSWCNNPCPHYRGGVYTQGVVKSGEKGR